MVGARGGKAIAAARRAAAAASANSEGASSDDHSRGHEAASGSPGCSADNEESPTSAAATAGGSRKGRGRGRAGRGRPRGQMLARRGGMARSAAPLCDADGSDSELGGAPAAWGTHLLVLHSSAGCSSPSPPTHPGTVLRNASLA